MKKKLAFIDYWHHKYTRSGDFLRDEFSKEFEITDFWWSKNSLIPINQLKKFDYIFFFQVIYPYRIIRKIGCKNVLWAPMYDGLIFRNGFFKWLFWKQIFDNNIKVLNFSKKIKIHCEKNNIKHLQVQYFNKPKDFKKYIDLPLNILFWDRGDIKIDDWIEMFNPSDVKKIYYIKTPDPGKINHKIDEYYLEKFNFEIIDRKFRENKNEFLEYLKKADVFIAPRKKEGIGLPTIEAISYGKYIIGFDDSTMNEYINDIRIGKLYKNNKDKIDISQITQNNKFRFDHANEKYNSWIADKHKINDFFLKDSVTQNKNFLLKLFFILDDIKNFLKTIMKRNYYKY